MSKVITFYSFKGGVGRSMAMANVAVLLSRWGFKVLVVDWDLEAPGIENFFKDFIDLEKVRSKPGILNLLSNVSKGSQTLNWRDLITSFKTKISTRNIDLLTAGKRGDEYFSTLKSLDLDKFYEQDGGGMVIENLRDEWKSEYDFILVDSRTGITDIGGICTIHLPDILILVFTPTVQSLEGTKMVAKKAVLGQTKLPFDRERLVTLPLPNRIDYQTEFQITKEWINRISKSFDKEFGNWLPRDLDKREFIEKIKIPYISYFSYGEELAVVVQGMTDPGGLGFAYENIASLIATEFEDVKEFFIYRDQFVKKAARIGLSRNLEHAKIKKLKALDIRFQELDSIPEEVMGLSHLNELDLSHNNLLTIPKWLIKINQLNTLDLSYNGFEDLPNWILENKSFRKLELKQYSEKKKKGTLYLVKNSITSIPPEVLEMGIDYARDYAYEKSEAKHMIQHAGKVLLIGEGGSGKTTFIKKLLKENLGIAYEEESTTGFNIHPYELKTKDGQRFIVNVCDFGGQEIYHATSQFFFTKRALYILFCDASHVNDKALDYWLNTIRLFGGSSPALIIENDKSGTPKTSDLRKLQTEYDNIKGIWTVNLRSEEGLSEVKMAIDHYIKELPLFSHHIPVGWGRIRKKLERLAVDKDYIDLDEYFNICSKYGVSSEDEALIISEYLHDTGLILHFKEDLLLNELFILNITWATDAVYKVLDNEEVKSNHGYLTEKTLIRIWSEQEYKRKRPQLLALMEKFQLCYQLNDAPVLTWLVPQLLPVTAPYFQWNSSGTIKLRYVFEFMPKGLFSGFVVRMSRYVQEPQKAWKSGVFLYRDNTEALVQETYGSREIQIQVRGEYPKEFMTLISEEFDAINKGYDQKLRFKKLVPCICDTCTKNEEPEFYDFENLKRRQSKGKETIECNVSYEDVDVKALLVGVFIEQGQSAVVQDKAVKAIEIFLASSNDLEKDRREVEIWLSRENKRLIRKGIFLSLNNWEDFLESAIKTRKQDDYNRAVQDCDVFIGLFATKVGKYSEEEFKMAFENFMKDGRTKYVYAYFKNLQMDISEINPKGFDSLNKFKDYLRELEHFPSDYDSSEGLILSLKNQLGKILKDMGLE